MCPGVTHVPGRKCYLCIGTYRNPQNPYCTAVLRSVPRDEKFPASQHSPGFVPPFRPAQSFCSGIPSACSAYSVVRPFSPKNSAKSPAISPIPPNSTSRSSFHLSLTTYHFSSQVLDFTFFTFSPCPRVSVVTRNSLRPQLPPPKTHSVYKKTHSNLPPWFRPPPHSHRHRKNEKPGL
jgi:hypothetical protein